MNHKHLLDRRSFIKTAGATLLLPALPSLTRAASPTTNPPRRICVIFFGNGVSLAPVGHEHEDWHWFPRQSGPDYQFTIPMEPLRPWRDQFSIIAGLSHPVLRSVYAHNTGGYFLTGADQRLPTGNTVSMDQVHAQYEGIHTRYPSLVLASEGGIGDYQRSHTLSFTETGQPIPPLAMPRNVYNELFSVSDSNPEAIRRSFGRKRSILDTAVAELKSTRASLGASDKRKLDQYLTSVRGIEERLDRAESWVEREKVHLPADQFDLDVDPREGPREFVDSMYNMITAAFLTDSTRTITFAKRREVAGGIANNFPLSIGLAPHHKLSHGTKEKDGFLNWSKYDRWLNERFAGFLKEMAETDDPIAEGSLLDNTLVLYGSGTSHTHITHNYPIILAGGKNMGFKHGAFHDFRKAGEDNTFNNLLLTMLQQTGVEIDRFGDSTGTFSELLKPYPV
jgi:hypothetical protein